MKLMLTGFCKIETILSRAEQSRAEQSRAQANCALFASCGCGALETAYYIRDG